MKISHWIIFRLFGVLSIFATPLCANLVIPVVDVPVVVTFDATLTGSNNGVFSGAGVNAIPAAGQLDSGAWSISGFDSVADLARGVSVGAVGTGGLYAFDTGGNRILGFQPTETDFTPGSVTLVVNNGTGQTINQFALGFTAFVFNDQGRSSSLDFAISADNISFTALSSFTTPVVGTGAGWSTLGSYAGTISPFSVANGSNLYLRWTSDDVGGSGFRDQFGIDSISINFKAPSAVPEPGTFALTALVALVGLLRHTRRHR